MEVRPQASVKKTRRKSIGAGCRTIFPLSLSRREPELRNNYIQDVRAVAGTIRLARATGLCLGAGLVDR